MSKKKKLETIAKAGSKGFAKGQMAAGSGNNYREYGALDPSDVVDKINLTYRGTGYTQDSTTLSNWIDLIQRTGTAGLGDYVRYRTKIYEITGPNTGKPQEF